MKRIYLKPTMERIQMQQKVALLTESLNGVMKLEGFEESELDPFAL